MTTIRAAVTGNHPLGEPLIQAILDYKYGRAGNDPIKELFQKELKQLLTLQKELSFPTLCAGLYGIEDLLRPFTRSLQALQSYEELGDLPINRFHYTNTFYRQPTLVEQLPNTAKVVNYDTNTLSKENVYSHEYLKNEQSRIILPGPVTFASFVNTNGSSPYSSRSEFIEASGSYLAKEITDLPSQYKEVQLDEPSLVWQRIPRTEWPSIQRAYQSIADTSNEKNIIVNTYFESADSVLSLLNKLPVDGIGVDLNETNLLKLRELDFSDKILQVGLIDPRNFILDDDGKLDTKSSPFFAKVVNSVLETNPKELIIGGSTGLEYLPREIADQRLKQLAEIIVLVKEELK